jgi:hypothetical protein
MLATGKKWSGINTVFSKGAIPSDLAVDFIDYFMLGGAGSKISESLGITGFAVTFDEEKKGIEIRKSVSDKAELGYGITQTQNKEEAQEITQKLSGELKVTDTISVSGEKEFKQPGATENSSEEQQTNDKIMLKFKKDF